MTFKGLATFAAAVGGYGLVIVITNYYFYFRFFSKFNLSPFDVGLSNAEIIQRAILPISLAAYLYTAIMTAAFGVALFFAVAGALSSKILWLPAVAFMAICLWLVWNGITSDIKAVDHAGHLVKKGDTVQVVYARTELPFNLTTIGDIRLLSLDIYPVRMIWIGTGHAPFHASNKFMLFGVNNGQYVVYNVRRDSVLNLPTASVAITRLAG